MGYMRHHAIIVTGWRRDKGALRSDVTLEDVHKKAQEIFTLSSMGLNRACLVSPIVESITNSYGSFFVAPDGSKEGWDESKAGDEARATFLQWLDKQRNEDKSSNFDWVEIQYGDDELITKVVEDSDAPMREAEGKPK